MVKERKEEGNNAYREDFEEENEIGKANRRKKRKPGFRFGDFAKRLLPC